MNFLLFEFIICAGFYLKRDLKEYFFFELGDLQNKFKFGR